MMMLTMLTMTTQFIMQVSGDDADDGVDDADDHVDDADDHVDDADDHVDDANEAGFR